MSNAPGGSRVGWGFDAHSLNQSPPLILGGVVVSDAVGVAATSDGDVLAHAVTDAVLGAAVLSDIGDHFPSDDPRSSGADSLRMLGAAVSMARELGWTVEHVDSTVVVEDVVVGPFRDRIRESLAGAMGVQLEAVSVKATTTDGLGFIGRGEGIAAVAVVTLTAAA